MRYIGGPACRSPGSSLIERRVVRGGPKWNPLESNSQRQSLSEACEDAARSDPDAAGVEWGPRGSISKAQWPLSPEVSVHGNYGAACHSLLDFLSGFYPAA